MRFGVIFLDPPWPYDRTHGQGIAEREYDLMTWDDIAGLGDLLRPVMAPNCAVLVWVTAPLLIETVAALGAWRGPKGRPLRYITKAFTWVKLYPDGGVYVGLGSHTRSNTEDVWLYSNGSPKRQAADVSQIVMARALNHSRKPDEPYRRAQALYPGPYLELFARRPRFGWTTLGNEIDGKDIRDALRDLAAVEQPAPPERPAEAQLSFLEAA